jgi:predicted ribosome quality control (RQC) complex YloA/Tae2 family protein
MNITSDKMRIVTRYIPSCNETVIYKIGKNAKNNFEIIDKSHPEDIWFHLSNDSSCHVIAVMNFDHYNSVCNNVNDPEKMNLRYSFNIDELTKKQKLQIIKQGAIICKEYSKRKSDKNVEVLYTNIENVCKTNVVGSVNAFKTKSIVI